MKRHPAELRSAGCSLYRRVKAAFIRLKIFVEEGFDFIKGDDIHPVVQVGVAGARDDHQLLVVALQFFESVFAEVTGVGFLAVDDQYGVADLPGVGEKGHVHEG